MTPFPIQKVAQPFDMELALPGSKSIALRQLAMCALTQGSVRVLGVPECDDTQAMLDSLARLGLQLRAEGDAWIVSGPMNFDDDVVLDVRMSGASTRLLLGLAALRRGQTHLDGHQSLRARTNKPMLEVIESLGASVKSPSGALPTTLRGPINTDLDMHIDGSISSQYITGMLIAAPGMNPRPKIYIEGELVSRPYIEITRTEMDKRGVNVAWQGNQALEISSEGYSDRDVHVEGDATAATYFAALATLHGSRVKISNLGHATHQGDYRFMEIMEQLGATVERTESTTTIQGPPSLRSLPTIDMTEMPDAALTLIAMGPLLPDGLRLTGLSSLHHKECDRLECPAAELTQMGVRAETTFDSIAIEPCERFEPHTVSTYHDHRMGMAFAVLGSATGDLKVDDERVVDKTYPRFWDDYARAIAGARIST